MTKKLLHKSLRTYLLYSTLLLLVAAPLFYFISQKLYLDDVDEALLQHKAEFAQLKARILKEKDVPTWNLCNRDIKILPFNGCGRDTLFSTFYFDSLVSENEPYRELNSKILIENQPYTYSGRINLVESEDLIESIGALFLALIVSMLAGLFYINQVLSKSLWKPFYDTLAKMEQFEIDKFKLPDFKPTDVEEFQRLNHSIFHLMERNVQIFKSQREFVENAAHELQTPLAVFQAQIDNLMQSAEFTESQFDMLQKLNENLARLSKLNRNLLLLSKIENGQFPERQWVDLKKETGRHFAFFVEQAKAKNIQIEWPIAVETQVFANPGLVEILINNLFLNAIRHNTPNGSIEIKLTAHALTFANTGKLEALPPNQLFHRFAKGNPSEAGSGLGLAIIKSIATAFGWKVAYQFENKRHHFSILF